MKSLDIVATRSDLLVQPTKVLPRLMMVRGEPLDPDHDHPAVGVYDIIRLHLRRDSPVQPLDSIAVERYRTGYRGIAVSSGDTFIFTFSSSGLAMRRADGDSKAVMQYVSDITDAENEATALMVAQSDDKAQDDFNRNMSGVNANQPGTAVPEDTNDTYTLMMQGPSKDTMERLPGRNRQINTQVPAEPMSAGGIVIRHDGKVLIVKPANGYGDYDWTFPKGHLEIEESVEYRDGGAEVAALREVYEETGFKCNLVRFIATVKHDDGGRCLYYEMSPKTVVPDNTDGEMSEHKWVTTVEAMELLNDDKDISLLSVAHKNCPKLVLKSTAKPYGHTSYTRKDPRTGKLINVKSKGVKPSDPVAITANLKGEMRATANRGDYTSSRRAQDKLHEHLNLPKYDRAAERAGKRRTFRRMRATSRTANTPEGDKFDENVRVQMLTEQNAIDSKADKASMLAEQARVKAQKADKLEASQLKSDPAHITRRQMATLVENQARNASKVTLSEIVAQQYALNQQKHKEQLAKEAERNVITSTNTVEGFSQILSDAKEGNDDWHTAGLADDISAGLIEEYEMEYVNEFFQNYSNVNAPSAHALGACMSSTRLGLVAIPISIQTDLGGRMEDNEVSYSYKIYGTAGHKGENVHNIAASEEPIGSVTRSFRVRDGEMHVHHSYFAIDDAIQGKGYAHELLSQTDLMYDALDVKHISVHANINIGGYTWAKFGFEWDYGETDSHVIGDIKAQLSDMMLDKLDQESDGYGGVEDPTFEDVSELEDTMSEIDEASDTLSTLSNSLRAYTAEEEYDDFEYTDDDDLHEYFPSHKLDLDSISDNEDDSDTVRYLNMRKRLNAIDAHMSVLWESADKERDAMTERNDLIEEKHAEAVSELEIISEFSTPHEMASYTFGREIPGRPDFHKIGKQAMLGSDWSGIMHRDGQHIMHDYIRERLGKISKSQADDGDEGQLDDEAWSRTVHNLGLDNRIKTMRAKHLASRKRRVKSPGSRGGTWHRDASGNVMYGVRKSLSFDIAKASQHTGVMIAFILEPTLASELALHTEGAEPASELHVTLAYLGKNLASDVIARTREVVATVASQYPNIEGTFGGIGRFCASPSSEGKDVIYASVDSSKLSMLREDLVQQLNTNKVLIDRTHGYTPHMTLTYVSPDYDSPITRLKPVAFTFKRLTIAVGGHHEHYDLAEFRKALPRKTKAQKDEDGKKETKPLKAGSKKTGSGGKVRYGYPAESKAKAPPKEGAAPKSKRPPSEPGKPTQSTKKPGQDPIIVPDDDNKDHKPQHTVSVSEFVKQTGTTREQLDAVVSKYPDREKFILAMMTKLSSFAEKHGLDNDYFGLLHDVLTKRAYPSPSDSPKPGSA